MKRQNKKLKQFKRMGNKIIFKTLVSRITATNNRCEGFVNKTECKTCSLHMTIVVVHAWGNLYIKKLF